MTPSVTSTTTGQQARIGSLFSGYGGLDMGVMDALRRGSVAWHVEFDDAPSRILAHHWPDVPNYGDITTVDWSSVEPVDVLTGGFPCQDVSLAGARAGLKEGTRSGLWLEFAKTIDAMRPQLVVIENVRGLLSAKTIEEVFDAPDSDSEFRAAGVGEPVGGDRPVLNAFGRVLLDLAELGYDAEWVGVRASDAGAPHGRFRVFILAHPNSGRRGEPIARFGQLPIVDALSESVAPNASRIGGNESDNTAGVSTEGVDGSGVVDERRARPGGAERPSTATNASGERFGQHARESSAEETRATSTDWGPYRPAIERWERVLGRTAPSPTEPTGKGGAHRLSPRFVEFMMGLPVGHVTDPAIGLTRNQQLKSLGNGVVPQQAALAVGYLLGNLGRVAA